MYTQHICICRGKVCVCVAVYQWTPSPKKKNVAVPESVGQVPACSGAAWDPNLAAMVGAGPRGTPGWSLGFSFWCSLGSWPSMLVSMTWPKLE